MADRQDDMTTMTTTGDGGLFASTFGCCAPTLRQSTGLEKERAFQGNCCFIFFISLCSAVFSGLIAVFCVVCDCLLAVLST
jgi:hypothetical protein